MGVITNPKVTGVGATEIAGTTTNDSAAAGIVGETISSTVLIGAPVSLATTTGKTVTSIALTAGDWDVGGSVSFNGNAATTLAWAAAATSLVDNTLPTGADGSEQVNYSPTPGGVPFNVNVVTLSIPIKRVSLAAPATVYLVATAAFAVSTCNAYGRISARRAR